jgi:hypothetical protein
MALRGSLRPPCSNSKKRLLVSCQRSQAGIEAEICAPRRARVQKQATGAMLRSKEIS